MTRRRSAQWSRAYQYKTAPLRPVCPDCGYDNWAYGSYWDGRSELSFGSYWDGPGRALDAGRHACLYTRKGRIYGGQKRGPYGGVKSGMPSVRVNERKWKVVRRGIRLLVACANEFHEDRTK